MSNKVRSTQAILIFAIVLLVGFLFTRDVKGLVKPKDAEKPATVGAAEVTTETTISIEEASATAKNLISTATAKEITALETDYLRAANAKKIELAKQLSKKWDDVEQAIPSGLYAEVVANAEPTLKNWLSAGTLLLKAFDNTPDSLIQPVMLQKANVSFKNALKIDSANNDAKTGLGVTIVNGMGAPMEGIAMLREVVAKEPKNLRANMNLGIFAIKSGQFDKAIDRFNLIINTIQASPLAYFYLGTSYESLGKNDEAINAYLNAKKLAASSNMSNFVDKKVAELKNKR
jgi:tetratricopeptide (TPR) repeat protein